MNKRARIYTDGCALYNKDNRSSAPVGWAYIIVDDETDKILKRGTGNHVCNTHNYAELVAIKEAMKMALSSTIYRYFDLYSDSRYCIDGINTYMHSWNLHIIQKRANGTVWKEVQGLHKKLKSKMNFLWIPGHKGNVFNETVDRMAKEAASVASAEARDVLSAIDFASMLNKEIVITVGENEKKGRLFSVNTLKNTIALQYENGHEFVAYLGNGNVVLK